MQPADEPNDNPPPSESPNNETVQLVLRLLGLDPSHVVRIDQDGFVVWVPFELPDEIKRKLPLALFPLAFIVLHYAAAAALAASPW